MYEDFGRGFMSNSDLVVHKNCRIRVLSHTWATHKDIVSQITAVISNDKFFKENDEVNTRNDSSSVSHL